MKKIFKCMACGDEARTASRSRTDQTHGRDRCMPCYKVFREKQVAEHLSSRKASIHERNLQKQQAEERVAKKLSHDIDKALSRTPSKPFKCTKANKLRMDEFIIEPENNKINMEHEL